MGHPAEYWREYRGFREDQEADRGACFRESASGEIRGAAICDVEDNDSRQPSCRILAAAAIGANTFPNPPGNEQNVCDNRP